MVNKCEYCGSAFDYKVDSQALVGLFEPGVGICGTCARLSPEERKKLAKEMQEHIKEQSSNA